MKLEEWGQYNSGEGLLLLFLSGSQRRCSAARCFSRWRRRCPAVQFSLNKSFNASESIRPRPCRPLIRSTASQLQCFLHWIRSRGSRGHSGSSLQRNKEKSWKTAKLTKSSLPATYLLPYHLFSMRYRYGLTTSVVPKYLITEMPSTYFLSSPVVKMRCFCLGPPVIHSHISKSLNVVRGTRTRQYLLPGSPFDG